ncbi:MAG TPA: hypothetical protein VML54_06265 [Candidatus Limnocylindrales bacterium]|nr:hypothetical protein [Candidatus Limnocylindrales bacterium]
MIPGRPGGRVFPAVDLVVEDRPTVQPSGQGYEGQRARDGSLGLRSGDERFLALSLLGGAVTSHPAT